MKYTTLTLKVYGAGGVAQVVKCLPKEHKAKFKNPALPRGKKKNALYHGNNFLLTSKQKKNKTLISD
jgi:hypothetical protein